jgi:predicted outer membrane lipoprotein
MKIWFFAWLSVMIIASCMGIIGAISWYKRLMKEKKESSNG